MVEGPGQTKCTRRVSVWTHGLQCEWREHAISFASPCPLLRPCVRCGPAYTEAHRLISDMLLGMKAILCAQETWHDDKAHYNMQAAWAPILYCRADTTRCCDASSIFVYCRLVHGHDKSFSLGITNMQSERFSNDEAELLVGVLFCDGEMCTGLQTPLPGPGHDTTTCTICPR